MDNKDAKSRFTDIYNRESDPLFRYILIRVSVRDEAVNILQESFTKLWQLMKESKVDYPKAFLYKVTRNHIIDWYRKKKSVSWDAMSQGEDGEEALEIKDEAVDEQIKNNAETSLVLKAMNKLSKDYREAVYLRFLEGLEPREIALILNESPNVVSVRISRGLNELRKILKIE